ncbi:MAG: helicase [Alphaproteobacteria bacterium]|nr:helicase [Alphaproteobacteria bacterium]MCB9797515.1 helicase [Alphaproteobacteria bacterium]
MSLDALFEALRDACSERAWSAGVLLARDGKVRSRASSDKDELLLTVDSTARSAPLDVWLWPDEEDWACSCESQACAHAAAAVIAARQAKKQGGAPVGGGQEAKLRYHLRRTERGVRVDRELELPGGQVEPLRGSLRQERRLRPRMEDREAEQVLSVARERIPANGWARLLQLWAGSGAAVLVDGEPCAVSAAPIPPVLSVKDEGRGFRLSLHRSGEVDAVLGEGLVLAGGVLRQTSDGGLDTAQRRALIRGVVYGPEEVATLVGEVLPRLSENLTLKVKTERLPDTAALKPNLHLSMRPDAEGLEARLDLVYGDPPVARLEGDRLVSLGGPVPIRDARLERALRDRAEQQLRLPIGRPWRLDEAEALRFVNERLAGFGGEIRGDATRYRIRKEPARIGITEDGRLSGDVSARALAEAWAAGRGHVPLLDGGYAPVPAELMERVGHVIGDLAAAADKDGRLPLHAAPAAAALAEALDRPAPADLSRLRPLVDGFEGLPEWPVPAGLQASLRPYQLQGYRWVRFLWSVGLGGILADDMGLGKTLQALCALADLEGPRLVVAPTSVIGNWEAEARRFLPRLRTCLFHGPRRRLDPEADLVITSYALMRGDPLIHERAWSAVVLDESQAIKNPESQTAQAAFSLRAERRLTLTGTPIENRLDELWSQLHFLMPGFLGGRASFRDRVERPVSAGDARAAEGLRARVRPFVLRRRKQDVAKDLPPRTDIVLRCELPESQREVYEAVRLAAREEVARMAGANRTLEVLELLLRLRQAACHPGLLPGRAPDAASGKLDELLLRLDEIAAEGHRALVFSQWTSFLDLIGRGLDGLGLGWCRLDGSTRDRQGVVARFQAEDGPPVFLISLKAGGTGLNLTAADYVFHVDPWWNPAVEQQATDRAHRIGQDKPVFAVKLIAADTVEERVLELQERKRALAEAALGEASLLQGLQREELLALFD